MDWIDQLDDAALYALRKKNEVVYWHIYTKVRVHSPTNKKLVYHIDALPLRNGALGRVGWESTTRAHHAAEQWFRRTGERIEVKPGIDRRAFGCWCFWLSDQEKLARLSKIVLEAKDADEQA